MTISIERVLMSVITSGSCDTHEVSVHSLIQLKLLLNYVSRFVIILVVFEGLGRCTLTVRITSCHERRGSCLVKRSLGMWGS
jgi:hypothetical protein